MGWFIWNGVDSRTMGVVVAKYPPVVYPAERAETTEVPGRSGFLTVTQGSHVYSGYLKTIEIGNYRAADHQRIAAWLRGSGTLVLGSEPDYVYQARVIKEASLDRRMRGVYAGAVGFFVQPEKSRMPPEGPVAWTAPTPGEEPETTAFPTLWNPGDVPAKPKITISATSQGAGVGPVIVIGIGTEAVTAGNGVPRIRVNLEARPTLTGCVIDLAAMTVTTTDGAENLNAYTTVLNAETEDLWIPPRESRMVSWIEDGINMASVSIEPRWRWL